MPDEAEPSETEVTPSIAVLKEVPRKMYGESAVCLVTSEFLRSRKTPQLQPERSVSETSLVAEASF